jgi:serine phosphatase RsbU (regulator of sigma subunit)
MSRNHRWLPARIAAAVLIGALVVGAGVALLLRNTLTLRSRAETTIRQDSYLLRVVDVESLVIDAETGLRGDVITSRSLFLQPLHRANSAFPVAERQLERSAAATGVDQPQVRALVADVNAYMSRYVPGVLALVNENPAAARSYAVTLEGKREVDAIRKLSGDLELALSKGDARRQRQARATANHSVDEAIAVLIVLTLLTAALGGYLGRLAVSRDRAREQSEETARTLQESILPAAMPTIPGCELAVRFIPGAGPISGDFYDGFMVAPDAWALVIGDVCGKGAPAAAATAMARWTLRSALGQGAPPSEALRQLNDVMLGHPEDHRFITALCMTVTLESDRAVVDLACAGHPPAILVPAAGDPAPVAARGDLLGVFPTIRLEAAEFELQPGESVVVYTDGVTDQGPETRPSPEQALRERVGGGADQLASALERLAQRPVGRHPDDIAIMAFRFLGGEHAEPRSATTSSTAT